MSDRLMSAEDLERVTGKKRYGKQVEWFRDQFGISIVRCSDGSPIITWATFNALEAKRVGLTADVPQKKRIVLVSDTAKAK